VHYLWIVIYFSDKIYFKIYIIHLRYVLFILKIINVPFILIMNLYLSVAFTKRLNLVLPKPQERQLEIIHGKGEQHFSQDMDTSNHSSHQPTPHHSPQPTQEQEQHTPHHSPQDTQGQEQVQHHSSPQVIQLKQQHQQQEVILLPSRTQVNSNSVPPHYSGNSYSDERRNPRSDRLRDLVLRCVIVSWVVFVVELIGYTLIGVVTAVSESPIISCVFFFMAIAPIIVDSYGLFLLFKTSTPYFYFFCSCCVKFSKRSP